jgi:hypothetical protein
MNRVARTGLVGVEVIGVTLLQAVAMFGAYGHGLGETLLALTLLGACALQVVLLSQVLRPPAAWSGAIALALAGAFVGCYFAFNRYGT